MGKNNTKSDVFEIEFTSNFGKRKLLLKRQISAINVTNAYLEITRRQYKHNLYRIVIPSFKFSIITSKKVTTF